MTYDLDKWIEHRRDRVPEFVLPVVTPVEARHSAAEPTREPSTPVGLAALTLSAARFLYLFVLLGG